MSKIRFEHRGSGMGQLYIDGHPVTKVLAIEPELFGTNELATVRITLAADEFVFVPAPKSEPNP